MQRGETCRRFVPHAWKPGKCKLCFQERSKHPDGGDEDSPKTPGKDRGYVTRTADAAPPLFNGHPSPVDGGGNSQSPSTVRAASSVAALKERLAAGMMEPSGSQKAGGHRLRSATVGAVGRPVVKPRPASRTPQKVSNTTGSTSASTETTPNTASGGRTPTSSSSSDSSNVATTQHSSAAAGASPVLKSKPPPVLTKPKPKPRPGGSGGSPQITPRKKPTALTALPTSPASPPSSAAPASPSSPVLRSSVSPKPTISPKPKRAAPAIAPRRATIAVSGNMPRGVNAAALGVQAAAARARQMREKRAAQEKAGLSVDAVALVSYSVRGWFVFTLFGIRGGI